MAVFVRCTPRSIHTAKRYRSLSVFCKHYRLGSVASACHGQCLHLQPRTPPPLCVPSSRFHRFSPNLTRAKHNFSYPNDRHSLPRFFLDYTLLSSRSPSHLSYRKPGECPCPAAMSSSEINQVLANSLSPGQSQTPPLKPFRPLLPSMACSEAQEWNRH